LHFSWISSAEGERFARFAGEVIESVKALGPNTRFVRKELDICSGEVV
jgi:F420-non-reducing hydrogenase iron-sulfur subunit